MINIEVRYVGTDKKNITDECISDTMRKVITDSLTRVIYATPVDTETARSNWRVTPLVPYPDDEIIKVEKDEKGKNNDRAFIEAQNLPDSDYLNVMYLSNRVPYIKRLDKGYSKQAEPGFVEEAIDQAIAAIGRGV